MVMCPDDMIPCPKAILSTQKRLHWGAICTSSKHFSAPPWQYNIAQTYRFGLVSGGCGAGAILVAAFVTVARRTMRISAMHQ